MMNLVTVVFGPELPILKTQAQSIDLYQDDQLVDQILVVVNDDANLISQIDTAWWGRFQDRVKILSRHVFADKFSSNGWHSQQLLKLLAAATSYRDWSMVLDAKTIFIKKLPTTHLFDREQRPCIGTCLPIPSVFSKSQQIVERVLDIELDNQLSPAGVPFFLNNRVVRSMISDIEKQTGQLFSDWFESQPDLTEFLLYSGYVKKLYTNYDVLYNIRCCNIRAVNIGHCEPDQIDQKFQDMVASYTYTVSIHRDLWQQMNSAQQQQYRDILAQRGITCEL